MRSGWEHRFPDLSGKWTHWEITGAGKSLAVVDGLNLIRALKIVEENYGRYVSVKVCRATVDEHGQVKEKENAMFEISNLPKDEVLREVSDGSAT